MEYNTFVRIFYGRVEDSTLNSLREAGVRDEVLVGRLYESNREKIENEEDAILLVEGFVSGFGCGKVVGSR